MSIKTNKLSIFLIKEEYKEFSSIASSDAIVVVEEDDLAVYAENSRVNKPGWIDKFFGEKYESEFSKLKILNSSSKGLFLRRISIQGNERIFALTFGFGRHLLEADALEERFGLKVVLNSIVTDSLRSIDKVSFGTIQKQSREQISKEGPASNFGIDIEQDLISSVTGKSNISQFGRTISGKDAAHISVKVDATDVDSILNLLYQQFISDKYKTSYDFIDNISDVKSKTLINSLYERTIMNITNGDVDRIWLVPPDIVDWSDVSGFCYLSTRHQPTYDDIHIDTYLKTQKGEAITLDKIRSQKIYLISASTSSSNLSWPVIRCIYAEIEINGSTYILNNGKWYKIEDSFVLQVNNAFDAVPEFYKDFIDYNHVDEGQYNKALTASIPKAVCLDADFIYHGGGRSKFEFCDVLTGDNEIIHVKRYGGSSQLSHLFAQAIASAELFISDEEFRIKLNDKLPSSLKIGDPSERPDSKKYKIVYAIISNSKKSLNVPFFSKISLRNAVRVLSQGYGFKVYKKKIFSLR